jgi:hypothetical protein
MAYTPPTGAVAFIDVWKAKFFPFDVTGVLDLPGYPTPATTPYEGIEFQKVKTLAPNLGAPRQIAVVSQGSTQTTFNLPSIDPQTIEAHLAYADLGVYADVTGVKARTIGGATVVPMGTNKVGFEKKGLLIVSALAAHTADDDSDVWYSNIYNSVKATFQWAAFNENPADVTVNFALGKKKKSAWGEALTESVDGATQAVGHAVLSWGQLNLIAWLGDGAEDTFLLPTEKQSLDTFADTFKVFDMSDGSLVTGTPSASQFIAGSAPIAEARLLGWTEIASGI